MIRNKKGQFTKDAKGINHPRYNPNTHIFITKKCGCGCKDIMTFSKSNPRQFISGHNSKIKHYRKEKAIKQGLYKKIIINCACGCGHKIIYRLLDIHPDDRCLPRFLHGHNLKNLTKKRKRERAQNAGYNRRHNGKIRLTPLYKLIKVSKPYQNWRKMIFERDNYICQKCGNKKNRSLEAHHIKPFAFIYKEAILLLDEKKIYQKILNYEPLFNMDNGITLCKKCHRKIKHPNYKRRKLICQNQLSTLMA